MKVINRLMVISMLVVCCCSCSARKMMVNQFTGILGNGISAFEQDDDLEMLEKAFPGNIKLLEVLLETSPNNSELLVLLARFYGSYALVSFEDKLERAVLKGDIAKGKQLGPGGTAVSVLRETLSRYYMKGTDYALKALEVHHGPCGDQLKQVSTRDQFFNKLTENDVPALFWYGFNLGAYVNLNRDSIKAVAMAQLAEKAMKRVIELNPGYYYGGAHLFLCAYYASRPPMLGGNLEAALSHYKHVKEIAGEDFLLADVYYGRFYLYQKQERKKFKDVMNRVVHYPQSRNAYPLYNKLAVIRAKTYLDAIDRLFE